jgi:hypothetical protein
MSPTNDKGKPMRNSTSSSSSLKRKSINENGGEEDDDGDDTPKIVADDLSALDRANIIPKSKRRAALRSGLVRSGVNDNEYSDSKPMYNSDDEEADF